MKSILYILIACSPLLVFASQDVVHEPLAIKYRYTSYGEKPELSIEFAKKGNKITELVLHWNNCVIPVPNRELKEFNTLDIDTLQMRTGRFFHEEMKGVIYITITFYLSNKLRSGNTVDSSFAQVGYTFWKNKYQQVSVNVPLNDESWQYFIRENGDANFESGSSLSYESYPDIVAGLKRTNKNNSNKTIEEQPIQPPRD